MVERNLAKVDVAGSSPVSRSIFLATSPSGKARVCKTLIPGSNPGVASNSMLAGVVELVDTRDLKSLGLFVRAGSSPASGTIN